ncbi:MAG: hypothetical protein PHH37_11255 [Paludibacter sp.]|nr:hypothetical protein [Paludibacter sp.]
MSYNYNIDYTNKIIFIDISGIIGEYEAADLGRTMRHKALEAGYSLVFNLKRTTTNISMGSAYFWFENHYDKINEKMRHVPTAYIIPTAQSNYYNFIQVICMNYGIRTRIFTNKTHATNWLRKSNS